MSERIIQRPKWISYLGVFLAAVFFLLSIYSVYVFLTVPAFAARMNIIYSYLPAPLNSLPKPLSHLRLFAAIGFVGNAITFIGALGLLKRKQWFPAVIFLGFALILGNSIFSGLYRSNQSLGIRNEVSKFVVEKKYQTDADFQRSSMFFNLLANHERRLLIQMALNSVFLVGLFVLIWFKNKEGIFYKE